MKNTFNMIKGNADGENSWIINLLTGGKNISRQQFAQKLA